jgi:hypothetical protein
MPPKQDIYVFIIPETRHANETGYLWNNNNLDILFRGHDDILE